MPVRVSVQKTAKSRHPAGLGLRWGKERGSNMDCHLCFPSSYRGKARILFVFSMVVFSLLFFSIKANAGTWTSNGPEGGLVYALAIDPVTPSTIYAGGRGGVYKSTNGGASWSQMSSGLTSTDIMALAIDPVTPSTIYAGGRGGVYKSTNGGANWSQMTSTHVYALAIDPVTPSTVYAGNSNVGVYKSTDGGTSWSQMSSGLTDTDIRALAIDPVTPSTIYAGTLNGGVFKSTNGGASWSAIMPAGTCTLNSGLINPHVNALAIDPVTPSTIYAGSSGGVYKSTNGGASWSQMSSGLTGTNIMALAIDPVTPSTIYAGYTGYSSYTGRTSGRGGVCKSTNGGASWFQMNSGLTTYWVHALAIDPVTPSTIYAGSSGGVYKSTNGGASWSQMSSGLTTYWVHALAIDPVTPSTIYAGSSGGGVFKSTNGGASWFQMNSGLTGTYVYDLAIDPVTPSTIYAAMGNSGVYKSMDGGASWSRMNSLETGFLSTAVYALAIHPGGGVIIGPRWSSVGNIVWNSVHALAIDPVTPSTIYAGNGGIHKSTDGGSNWFRRSYGLASIDVRALAIDPVTPSTVYAGTYDGVFKSTNGGASWSPMNSGLSTSVRALAIDPVTPNTIYAGTGGGVFKSTNGGASWSPMNSGLTDTHIYALAIDPSTPSTIYAGTYGGGVFVYREAGTATTCDITFDHNSCKISLDPGDRAGQNADWWLGVDTPAGWYYYDIYQGAWMPGFSFLVYQGPLFDLPPSELPAFSNMPMGTCTFYFAVDTTMNGQLDGNIYYDTVVVQNDTSDDSGPSCHSLKFTPVGTTLSCDLIDRSLEFGASEQITLLTTACGQPVTVSSVTKTSEGVWLSASSGGGSKVILELDAGTSGVQAGATYAGTVNVVAGGITDNMYVTLRVEDWCGETYTNSLGMTFNLIPAGTFMMGSPEDELGRYIHETQHRVTLTSSFYMQTTEVTQVQWEAVMGSNLSYFSECGGNCPVNQVSWYDVQDFITALNSRGEGTYRLPTEAEWEYAARAGSTTAFANGDITVTDCGLDPNLDAMGWYCGNSAVTYDGCFDSSFRGGPSCAGTHPVAQKLPNAWGLYDMHGNVWEWVQDWYGYYPTTAVTDPTGPETGSHRVFRGGSWGNDAQCCRSACRDLGTPGNRCGSPGFRLLRLSQ